MNNIIYCGGCEKGIMKDLATDYIWHGTYLTKSVLIPKFKRKECTHCGDVCLSGKDLDYAKQFYAPYYKSQPYIRYNSWYDRTTRFIRNLFGR